MLGHEQLTTTQIYTHVSIKALTEVHARCHPHGRMPEPASLADPLENADASPNANEPTGKLSSSPPAADPISAEPAMPAVLPVPEPALEPPQCGGRDPGDGDAEPGCGSIRRPTRPRAPGPRNTGNRLNLRPLGKDRSNEKTVHVTDYTYRYMDPLTGRWTSPDPIEEQGGINLYEFVRNNPNDIFDPLGLYEFVGYPSKDWIAIGASSPSTATAVQVYAFRRISDCGKKTSSTSNSTDVHLGALPSPGGVGEYSNITYLALINKGVTTDGKTVNDWFAAPCTSGEAILKVTFVTLDQWHIDNQRKLDYLVDVNKDQVPLFNSPYANGNYEEKGKRTNRDPKFSYHFVSGRLNETAWGNNAFNGKIRYSDGIVVKVKWNFCSGHGDFDIEAYNLVEGNIDRQGNPPIAGQLTRGHRTPEEPPGYAVRPDVSDGVFRASIKYPPTP